MRRSPAATPANRRSIVLHHRSRVSVMVPLAGNGAGLVGGGGGHCPRGYAGFNVQIDERP